ncbi:hypothetical protein GOODEAATRI_016481 [Goodea atripinnis]|uniref:Uncharacterized protein n=1 Tax=Goodea atripinnis TaxID=208336 RepID=A0ABV0PPC4_9TELE
MLGINGLLARIKTQRHRLRQRANIVYGGIADCRCFSGCRGESVSDFSCLCAGDIFSSQNKLQLVKEDTEKTGRDLPKDSLICDTEINQTGASNPVAAEAAVLPAAEVTEAQPVAEAAQVEDMDTDSDSVSIANFQTLCDYLYTVEEINISLIKLLENMLVFLTIYLMQKNISRPL